MYVINLPPIRTNPQLFRDRLQEILWPPREITAMDGNYLVKLPADQRDKWLIVNAYWLPGNEPAKIIYVPGVSYYYPDDDLDQDPPIIELFNFKISQLSIDRISVVIKLKRPEASEYLADILKVLMIDYEELGKGQQQTEQVEPTIQDARQRQGENPWEKIKEHSWDRLAIEMWCNGYTCPEIADKISVTPESVNNKISELRRNNPEAGIPYDKERKQKLMRRNDKK